MPGDEEQNDTLHKIEEELRQTISKTLEPLSEEEVLIVMGTLAAGLLGTVIACSKNSRFYNKVLAMASIHANEIRTLKKV